jgi:hypothetical protein
MEQDPSEAESPSASQENPHLLWNMKVHYHVRFQVLTVASMKIKAFWDIASCGLRVD